jgi:hypothetical protein
MKTPRGALATAGLGMNLYSLMNKAGLPGAAKQALGSAGQMVPQAQSVITSGGMGSPLWQQQKQSIDAQIDQQKANFASAVQQSAQSSGMGGANSMVVQQQIAQVNSQLEAQRQAMYQQVLQQNVNNAVAELTGANQTLMDIAKLQYEEDQNAQALARSIGATTTQLASLFPG